MSANLLPLAFDVIIAVIAMLGGFMGYWFGKRKRAAETQSLNAAASETTVNILLKGLRSLENEIESVTKELEELTGLNERLKARNEELMRQISGYALHDLKEIHSNPPERVIDDEADVYQLPYIGGQEDE